MAEIQCENCAWRAKYDNSPKSILGRLWRWHIGFCPGWKKYMESLPEDRLKEIKTRYNLN